MKNEKYILNLGFNKEAENTGVKHQWCIYRHKEKENIKAYYNECEKDIYFINLENGRKTPNVFWMKNSKVQELINELE